MEDRGSGHGPDGELLRIVRGVGTHALVALGPDATIRSFSTGARALFGHDVLDVLGRHVSLLYPDPTTAARHLEAATSRGDAELDGWWLCNDGTRFWGTSLCSAARDAAGALVGFVHVTRRLARAVQGRDALRESEERFRQLVESVKDYAIFMLDETGHVVTWNAGARAIKGYEAAEIIGEHIEVFYPREDQERRLPHTLLERATIEGRVEHEGWRVRKDGTRFWADVVLTTVRDAAGRLVGFAKVTRDLTDRRKLEEERLRSTQALEAVRVREDFLSVAAHELRTPLSALLLQLEATRERLGTRDVDTQRRLQRAIGSGHRLADLIQALLDVSRVSTGNLDLQLERCDLRDAAGDVLERLREAAVRAGCCLTLASRGSVEGMWDRMRLEQVLTNLVWNAVKYARGTGIEVCLEGGDGEVTIEVADRGPGIPPDALPRLFERFARGDPMPHDGGLGLGLYLAREITAAHGGTITARNRDGGGASFIVRLPRRVRDHAAAPPRDPPATGHVG